MSNEPVGIVVFAGSAYKQLPITTDYSAAKMFLQNIQVGMLTDQGTDIGNAINTCLTSFNFENGVAKTIILITDGEDNEQKAIIAANEAKEKGAKPYKVQGAPNKLVEAILEGKMISKEEYENY